MLLSQVPAEEKGNHPTTSSSLIKMDQGDSMTKYIFNQNIASAALSHDISLPVPGDRITTTTQLAYSLSLCSSLVLEENITDHKLQSGDIDPHEQKRLKSMATDMVRAFIREDPKTHEVISEIVSLVTVLDLDEFRKLLMIFVDGINNSYLLENHLLDGLAQLLRNAKPGFLEADDLIKILELLNMRLKNTHSQATENTYRLTVAISNVLDSMVDSQVSGLSRENIHEPLSGYLKGLKGNPDPYFVYQAEYAYQAIQYIPNDETILQSTMRRTGRVVRGISGVVSAVRDFDIAGLIEGLQGIQVGLSGAVGAFKLSKEAYPNAKAVFESGQELLSSLKDFKNTQKSAWYPALRCMDRLIQEGRLLEFERLVREAPCQDDPSFQWGVCQRLGEISVNHIWDIAVRKCAITFLGELYQDDSKQQLQPHIKQWIQYTLNQLIESPNNNLVDHVKSLLQNLGVDINLKSKIESEKLRQINISSMMIISPPLQESRLLAIVQDKPDVETPLIQLKRERLQVQGSDVYISPRAKSSFKATDDFDLRSKVQEFLESDRDVLLLLGDSGSGKSTFNRALETSLWESYNKPDKRIPLFIYLPSIERPAQDMIGDRLREANFAENQILELKKYHEFILICDGYDEIQETRNLYISNQLNKPEGWRAKMLISCRTEYIGVDYKDYFQPTDWNSDGDVGQLQEAVMKPFNRDQIEDYIKQYELLGRSSWKSDEYLLALKKVRNLQDLVKNPFLLRLALEVLPHLFETNSDFSSASITRVQLYDEFVKRWIDRNRIRLREIELSARDIEAFKSMESNFKQYGFRYLKELASAIYEHNNGNPVVSYLQYRDRNTWKELLFNNEDGKNLLREVVPLTHDSDFYRFIHKSIYEYGFSLVIYDPHEIEEIAGPSPPSSRRGSVSSLTSLDDQISVDLNNPVTEQPLLESPLGKRSLVKERATLQFLAERVQQDTGFKDQLYTIVKRSSLDKSLRIAAANSITILVRAGFTFNGVDLQNIQIPGADLTFGVFDSALLKGADLRKVNLRSTWMRQANLNGALLNDAMFGELPFIQEDDAAICCSYSPDGKIFAAGIRNGDIKVYETSNWNKLFSLQGHQSAVNSISFSPSGDRIISGSDDKTVRLWNIDDGECIHTFIDHTKTVYTTAYSSNGSQFASGSNDTTVRLWNADNGECVHVLQGHSEPVYIVTYSPKGDYLVSGSFDKTLRLWDVASGDCIHTFVGHCQAIRTIAYSPKGDRIASGGSDCTARLWNVETGECIHTLEGHRSYVMTMVFSPTGSRIATGSMDRTVRLWDVETGECVYILEGHSKDVYSVMYSPKGDRVATGSEDSTIRLWDAYTGECFQVLQGHSLRVTKVLFSPNKNLISSLSEDKTIRLWDIDAGESINPLHGHEGGITCIAYLPKADQIATGSKDSSVRLWDINTGACIRNLQGHSYSIECVVYSPQGDTIASASCDKTIRLWKVDTGACLRTFQGHLQAVCSIVYSPKGDRIVSGSSDKMVRIWDIDTGECVQTLKSDNQNVKYVLYSLKGDYIVSGGGDGKVRLWNTTTFECIKTLEGRGGVYGIVCSPNGDRIANGTDDETIKLWEAETGELIHTFQGHLRRIHGIAFSPSGNQIVSCSGDKTARLWDVETGKCIFTLKGHTREVKSIAYSQNGEWIASGSDDNTVRLWSVETGQHLTTILGFRSGINRIISLESNGGTQCLITGSDDKSVRCWRIEKEGAEYKAFLCWSSPHEVLTVSGASIDGVRGLSPVNQKLLIQREALTPEVSILIK